MLSSVTPPRKNCVVPPIHLDSPPVSKTISTDYPDDRHQAGNSEAVHQYREHVLGLNKTAIEQR